MTRRDSIKEEVDKFFAWRLLNLELGDLRSHLKYAAVLDKEHQSKTLCKHCWESYQSGYQKKEVCNKCGETK